MPELPLRWLSNFDALVVIKYCRARATPLRVRFSAASAIFRGAVVQSIRREPPQVSDKRD